MLKSVLKLGTVFIMPLAALAGTESFDQVRPGSLPTAWACGVTGGGAPKWTIAADSSAPSSPNVLKQSGSGTFPWCVKKDVSITDGFVEVQFKPIDGREDQAGGIVWRWKDGDTYYVASANALENNVSLYHVESGQRITIQYVDAPVEARLWHRLRVEFVGKHIKVMLDGKSYIDVEDAHFADAGAVGVWTKADSMTEFDNFSFGGP